MIAKIFGILTAMKKYTTINEYIASFPQDIQVKLEQMRKTIQTAAPDAIEAISYGLATFKLNGNLVHFGAFKEHIGFYPAPRGIEAFKEELAQYDGDKGTIRFPLDKPLPLELVTKIVKFRVKDNLAKKK